MACPFRIPAFCGVGRNRHPFYWRQYQIIPARRTDFNRTHLPHVWRSDEIYFDRNSHSNTSGIVIYLNENFLGDHILEKEEMLALKKLFIEINEGT